MATMRSRFARLSPSNSCQRPTMNHWRSAGDCAATTEVALAMMQIVGDATRLTQAISGDHAVRFGRRRWNSPAHSARIEDIRVASAAVCGLLDLGADVEQRG